MQVTHEQMKNACGECEGLKDLTDAGGNPLDMEVLSQDLSSGLNQVLQDAGQVLGM